jgi:hypothetical protein
MPAGIVKKLPPVVLIPKYLYFYNVKKTLLFGGSIDAQIPDHYFTSTNVIRILINS